MNARCFVLPAILVALFAVSWSPADELPKAPPPHMKKTKAELLIGSWKEVYPELAVQPDLFEVVDRYTKDGRYEVRVWDSIRGNQMTAGTYQLEGNTLRFHPQYHDDHREEILDRVTLIEKLTEEQLVTVTITRKRWAPEMAKNIAAVKDLPVEQVLAEVREERTRPTFYVRVQDP